METKTRTSPINSAGFDRRRSRFREHSIDWRTINAIRRRMFLNLKSEELTLAFPTSDDPRCFVAVVATRHRVPVSLFPSPAKPRTGGPDSGKPGQSSGQRECRL